MADTRDTASSTTAPAAPQVSTSFEVTLKSTGAPNWASPAPNSTLFSRLAEATTDDKLGRREGSSGRNKVDNQCNTAGLSWGFNVTGTNRIILADDLNVQASFSASQNREDRMYEFVGTWSVRNASTVTVQVHGGSKGRLVVLASQDFTATLSKDFVPKDATAHRNATAKGGSVSFGPTSIVSLPDHRSSSGGAVRDGRHNPHLAPGMAQALLDASFGLLKAWYNRNK